MIYKAVPTLSPCAEVMALPVPRSDADLVRGLRDGDAWARAVLLDRFGTLVVRTARRFVASAPSDPVLAPWVRKGDRWTE